MPPVKERAEDGRKLRILEIVQSAAGEILVEVIGS